MEVEEEARAGMLCTLYFLWVRGRFFNWGFGSWGVVGRRERDCLRCGEKVGDLDSLFHVAWFVTSYH